MSVLRKHLVIGHFSFFLVFFFSTFYWSPSIGKLCMTAVSFVKITESNEVNVLENNVRLLLLHKFNGLGFKRPPRDLPNVNA